ncbi:PDZ domain-containing protein [Pedobacter hiemivivus]|jgi:serine protease Do|uniref:PDZ domain-containing protein n=1 Tax=Pedobacter hiemivivus TaxID=2530454 RepID=A0A4R0NBE6_9SPHI|nr:trypsin-like peptidase domain-containing protein [Pedobacter hiemivivus]TCC97621.1 PDZ domain-containing protein [Pedobacter hiemivivus]TKC60360.1 PDZ domain-containing protein [Pedobacter hiemivivus]
MKRIGLIALAAFIGGAAALGGYKWMEHKNDNLLSFADQQKVLFASNAKISSAGAVDFVEAAAAVSPAVVHIKTSYSGGGERSSSPMDMFDFFGGGGRKMQRAPRAASGSGVILTPDGYIVTNNHVVDNADKIEVILSDRRKVSATIVGKDPNTDLALIKVDATDLPVVKMGNSDNVQIGEWVLAVGFPLDLQTTVTAGIVSAKSRSIGILARDQQQPSEEDFEEYQRTGKMPARAANTSIESYIQTDAAINPGNSGGALVNANGELVGINAAIASQTGTNVGYGFAIPVNLAKKILDDFRKYGAVKRGYIGVTFSTLDADLAEKLNVKDNSGLYVNEVLPGSGAAAAGLLKGDIIKKIDGNIIYDSPDLQEKIGRLSPGDKVELTYSRNGQLKDTRVTLKGDGAATKPEAIAKNGGSASIEKLGASFAPASAQLKNKYGAKSGVVVTGVVPGKIFDSLDISKGLLVTAVNGRPVNSAKDIEAALPQSRNGMTTISGVTAEGKFTYSF